jgi:molybdenum-dependent DNA-binding transcriptional regulator ModE
VADGGDAYDVMDLKALRCLWAVARLGSLTKAGIELGVSESAISQRLKALESHVGSKLYETPGGRCGFAAPLVRWASLASRMAAVTGGDAYGREA